MRAALLVSLLLPISLNAQEIDKQKLLEMLRLPSSTFSVGISFTFDGTKPHIPGQDQWIRAEIAKLKKTLKHEPSDWAIWKAISDRAVDLNDLSEDHKACEEELTCIKVWLVQQPNDKEALLGLTDALLGLRNVDEAFANAQALVKRYPAQASAWTSLARCYAARKSFDESLKAYEKATTLSPDDPEVHLEYAMAILCEEHRQAFGTPAFQFDQLLAYRQTQASGQNSFLEGTDKTAKDKAPIIASGFLPDKASKQEPTQNLSDAVRDMAARSYRKSRDEAERAAKLYRQRDSSNFSLILALITQHVADGCDQPATSAIRSAMDCFLQPDVMNELKRLNQVCPDELVVHYTSFFANYLKLFNRLVAEKRLSPESYLDSSVRWKNILTKEEWQEIAAYLQLESRIKDLTPEKAVLAHYVLSVMAESLGDSALAISHARQLCELAPEQWDNWHLLAGELVLSGCAADVLTLKDKWLKYHPTADTHFLLAKAAEKTNDWKLVRYHVVEGLKLDPKHVKLLYSQVVADLKIDNSPAALKVADDHLKKMKAIVEKNAEPQKLTSFEDFYVIQIVVSALSGDLETAHQGVNASLQYYPQNPDFPKLNQLLGVTGLHPPTLGKP